MSPDKLVTMANQIATFFESQPGADRAARVAAHLNDFWAPKMRGALLAHAQTGAGGLKPLLHEALPQVRDPR